jgi:hypothetical protein
MVFEHQSKIRREENSPAPNPDLIAYWERRVRIVEQEIGRLEKKLRGH